MNSRSVAVLLGTIACVVLGTTGCETVGSPPDGDSGERTPAALEPRSEATDGSDDSSAKQKNEEARKPDARLSSVHVPRQKPVVSAEDIVGISEYEVASLFGFPEKVMERPPAVVWRYSSQKCHLSLFFYMDVNTDSLRVLTYEVEPEKEIAAQCITAVRDGFANGRKN